MQTMPPVPIVSELLLIGGGHSHALVLRNFAMRPLPGVRLTLVNPGPTAPYSGMLPGHVAGHYARETLDIDLVQLARAAGARLVVDTVSGLDPTARIARTEAGRVLPYDIASVDVGITARMPDLPGFSEHGLPAKPLGRFADRWAQVCAGRGPLSIAILGGGVAGAELAMAAAHRMAGLERDVHIALIDRGRILGSVTPGARRRLIDGLTRWRIELVEKAHVREVTADAVHLEDGRRIASDLTIGAAGAMPHPWLAETGLETEGGYLRVDRFLRTSDPAVYAVGDCAHFSADPRPKAGVYAVRAAPVLAHNLRADLTGSARKPFAPQRDFLKLVTLGDKRAIAERSGLALGGWGGAGPWIWRWKDRIDQRFMDRFRDLPEMTPPAAPRNAARGVAQALSGPQPCGGCGAKLGADALGPAIARHHGAARDDVTPLPGDDAGLLRIGTERQVLSTDHLRAFTLDPARVARVAAIHALGDIWAMGARPQAALATVILPRMVPRLQGAWLDEVMEAAAQVFAEAGAAILGGHSSMGSELTVGFSVSGLLERQPVTLSGGQPGDALILTKPLGSGVILAAEMRGKAAGADVLASWEAMERPQGRAAACLAPMAHAMTDVTGFGLAGHLDNICRASGTGAEIRLDALPFLDGAEALAEAGIASTLMPQNRAALARRFLAPEGPRAALCLDPQTAGGLLAAVPMDHVEALLSDLSGAGYPAAQIGHLTDEAGVIRVG